MTIEDPAVRLARIRDHFTREQAKLTLGSADTKPTTLPSLAPQPDDEPPTGAPAPTGVPAPNPALGSSASGPPDPNEQLRDAEKRGDWQTVIALLHGRQSKEQN
jgi:hypothetical protein